MIVAKEKIGKYVYGTPLENNTFQMHAPPIRQKGYLMPLVWAYSYVRKALHGCKIHKINMEGVKPPYLLLGNHNAFFDFYILSIATFPHRGIYPCAVDDFIGREGLLRRLGGIPTRKFTTDLPLIRTCRRVLKGEDLLGIYPEARYSLCGVTEYIPHAVGQLAKASGVPVVTLRCCGHHIYNPFWCIKSKRLLFPTEAYMTCLFTPEQLAQTDVTAVNQAIRAALYQDDFRWQFEQQHALRYRKRAQGLHKVLYHCPRCLTEYAMDSKGSSLFCRACGKVWHLTPYGQLEAQAGQTEFLYPTDWYKWERQLVRREVEAGTYAFTCHADVNELPGAKGFHFLGEATLTHDMTGFHVYGKHHLTGEPFSMEIPAKGQYACHVEFNYRYGGGRDCVDLNTTQKTWYLFPKGCQFAVTKLSLATEELYRYYENKSKEVPYEE